MDTSLRALLKDKNGVHDEIVKWLEDNQCLSIENFANWVDARSEIEAKILAKTPKSSDVAQLARLKQAWREADAHATRGVKRAAEGLAESFVDEPLPPEVLADVQGVFLKAYSWTRLDARQVGCDTLHGRCRREFERKQPSMFEIFRVRTLAHSQRAAPAKKQRLTDRVNIEYLDGEDLPEDSLESLSRWFHLFDVLCRTWAITGCFEVQFDGQVRRYAHWEDISAYLFEFKFRTLDLQAKYTQRSVLDYVRTVEDAFRVAAIELARSREQVPWGIALVRAQKDLSNVWNDHKDLLKEFQRSAPKLAFPHSGTGVKGRGSKGGSKGVSAPAASGGGSHQGGDRAGGSKAWKTAQKTADGTPICKKFNDQRGCQTRSCKYSHVCDVLLSSGGPCGSGSHSRMRHNPGSHGAPAIRSA